MKRQGGWLAFGAGRFDKGRGVYVQDVTIRWWHPGIWPVLWNVWREIARAEGRSMLYLPLMRTMVLFYMKQLSKSGRTE